MLWWQFAWLFVPSDALFVSWKGSNPPHNGVLHSTPRAVFLLHYHIYLTNLLHEPFKTIGQHVPLHPGAFSHTYFEENEVRIVG
jgi:hypothetical protein